MSIKDLVTITNNYQLISIYDIDNDDFIVTDFHAGSHVSIESLVFKYKHMSWNNIKVFSIFTENDVLRINI